MLHDAPLFGSDKQVNRGEHAGKRNLLSPRIKVAEAGANSGLHGCKLVRDIVAVKLNVVKRQGLDNLIFPLGRE